MPKAIVVQKGDRYGKWVVIEEVEPRISSGRPFRRVKCECDCGSIEERYLGSLRAGNSKSCGCVYKTKEFAAEISRRNTKHGFSRSHTYGCYYAMIGRCTNPNTGNWDSYGGIGIKVCDRWLESFENFLEDMGEAPTDKHSIDRKDNKTKEYSKDNCRWGTQEIQCQNKSNSRLWYIRGMVFPCAREASERFGVTTTSIHRWCKGYVKKGKVYPPKPDCWSELKYA